MHYFTVQKVSDGDTATLKNLTDNGIVKVRFLCIDAPEKSQGDYKICFILISIRLAH